MQFSPLYNRIVFCQRPWGASRHGGCVLTWLACLILLWPCDIGGFVQGQDLPTDVSSVPIPSTQTTPLAETTETIETTEADKSRIAPPVIQTKIMMFCAWIGFVFSAGILAKTLLAWNDDKAGMKSIIYSGGIGVCVNILLQNYLFIHEREKIQPFSNCGCFITIFIAFIVMLLYLKIAHLKIRKRD